MFKALRPFKSKTADGSYREVKPGDDVPEAKDWKHLDVYIRRRWITNAAGEMYDRRVFVSGKKARHVVVSESSAPAPAPKPAPMPEPMIELETDPDMGGEGIYTREDLERMKKADLIEVAQLLELPSEGTKADLIAMILGESDG